MARAVVLAYCLIVHAVLMGVMTGASAAPPMDPSGFAAQILCAPDTAADGSGLDASTAEHRLACSSHCLDMATGAAPVAVAPLGQPEALALDRVGPDTGDIAPARRPQPPGLGPRAPPVLPA